MNRALLSLLVALAAGCSGSSWQPAPCPSCPDVKWPVRYRLHTFQAIDAGQASRRYAALEHARRLGQDMKS